MVVPVERPTHPLRQTGGHGHGQPSTGTEDSHQLGDRQLVGPDVLQHLRRDDAVERGVGERQREGVGVQRAASGRGRELTGGDHRVHEVPHVGDDLRAVVERDDGGAAPHRFVGVTTTAAPEVEHALSGAQLQSVEVDGEH